MGAAIAWTAVKTRAERAAEVQTEAGTIATTAAAVLNEYFASLDALASLLVRHPALQSLDGPASTRLFKTLLSEQPLVNNITLRPASGTLIASAVPPPSPAPAPLKEFTEVMRTGRPAASQLMTGAITRRQTVLLGYPVLDESKKP